MTGRVLSCFCTCMSVLPLVLAGCGDQVYDKNYYLLEATRQAESIKTETNHLLEIRRFTIDSAFDGQGFVYRTGRFEYESDFYNEFLISPSAMVTEKTRNWLSGSGLFNKVLDVGSQIDPTHILEGNIIALYGDFRDSASPEAIIEIRIFLLRARANQELAPVFGKTYKSSVAMESKDPEALVQSLDRCLEGILSNLEEDLAKELSGFTEG